LGAGRGRNVGTSDEFPQFNDLALHFRVPTPLPDASEVGFDFAVQFQSTTSAAGGERILYNVAPELS
jgi:hypothetical protein